jgi:hypothetical protein
VVKCGCTISLGSDGMNLRILVSSFGFRWFLPQQLALNKTSLKRNLQ